MNIWINNLSLELIRQNSLSSCSSPSPPPISKQTQTLNSSISNQNLSERNVNILLLKNVESKFKIFKNLSCFKLINLAINSKEKEYNDLKSQFELLKQKSNNKVPENIKYKMDSFLNNWEKLEESIFPIKLKKNESSNVISIKNQAPNPPSLLDPVEKVSIDQSNQDIVNKLQPITTDSYNNLEIQANSLETTSQIENIPNGVKLIAISEFNEETATPNREMESLINDLFDWLVWIDHTLE